MRRRTFLATVGLGTASVLAWSHRTEGQMHSGPGTPGSPGMGRPRVTFPQWPMGAPLRHLPLLGNETTLPGHFEARLQAAPRTLALLSLATSELWTFNASYPGPILELREGERARIAFSNALAVDSTIHWHGLPVPAEQDGNPMDPVAPGATRVYEFDVPLGSAGTYWYHPHAHELTALEVGYGLAGPLIVRGADDPLAAIPEVTLMITELVLDAQGQVASAGIGMFGGGMMGGQAGVALVNGQRQPVHWVTPGATERWRIVNATAGRYLRLSLDDHSWAVVGTDGGLMNAPIRGATEWLLAPAQRVEIVVTFDRRVNRSFTLRDLGYAGGMMSRGEDSLMTVATDAAPVTSSVELPERLRWTEAMGPALARQELILSSASPMMGTRFLINGRTFDPGRVDLRSVVGQVEDWTFVNTSMVDHPMHLHGTQFQVISSSVPGPTIDRAAWFDTVNVPARASVTIRTRQLMPGKRMVHCHLLAHEDAGMMSVLEVAPA